MNQVVEIISGSTYILNSNILIKLKNIVNADIVLFDREGRVIQSTLNTPVTSAINKDNVMTDSISGGIKYRTITRSLMLPGYNQSFISLWMPVSETNQIKAKIVVMMGVVSLFGIFAMGIIGFIIARSITSPVENLVDTVKKITSGEPGKRAQLYTRDEIGLLANAFNNMFDRIKESEKKLVESEKMATAGKMAAGIAHEIKNPLTGIKMMAQILHRRLKGQMENQDILSSFIKEINRLDHIINEIINRARQTRLHRVWGQLNMSIKEVLELVREGYSEDGIDIKLSLSDDLPEIFADHAKIKQVLWNLILNSREAMPGGGTIEIVTGVTDKAEVEVIIRDSGQGIKDDPDIFFQPFFTSKPEGVGLGLTMSRKIIDEHGGVLFLRNRTGGGAEAVFRMPVDRKGSLHDQNTGG